jgi:hypothetical protein
MDLTSAAESILDFVRVNPLLALAMAVVVTLLVRRLSKTIFVILIIIIVLGSVLYLLLNLSSRDVQYQERMPFKQEYR